MAGVTWTAVIDGNRSTRWQMVSKVQATFEGDRPFGPSMAFCPLVWPLSFAPVNWPQVIWSLAVRLTCSLRVQNFFLCIGFRSRYSETCWQMGQIFKWIWVICWKTSFSCQSFKQIWLLNFSFVVTGKWQCCFTLGESQKITGGQM